MYRKILYLTACTASISRKKPKKYLFSYLVLKNKLLLHDKLHIYVNPDLQIHLDFLGYRDLQLVH